MAGGAVHGYARQLLRRWPRLEAVALSALDLWCQLVLFPFRRPARRGRAVEMQAFVAATDSYNRAAEHYFASVTDRSFLLNKPFSEPAALPKHLIDAGVLIASLRVAPGDVVMEIGAGSCWLSHILNRYGCRTIAVDVSSTALDIGRQLFEADAWTRWDLQPEFMPYDGHRLPASDGACDGIVINDAFHHLPNQRELLNEIHRVLRADGTLAMSEPGRGHGSTAASRQEADEWGVLENELVLEDVAALAEDCGFANVHIVASSPFVHTTVPAKDLRAFMGGKGFAAHWKSFCGALERHHYIVCAKQGLAWTTKRPSRLTASIEVLDGGHAGVHVGTPLSVRLRIRNAGDTAWIGGEQPKGGWTRLGAHLYRADDRDALIDFDWWRHALPRDLAPGDTLTLHVILPPVAASGVYAVVFDLVVEGVAWFAESGSSPARLIVQVA